MLYLTPVEVPEDTHTKQNVNMMENTHRGNNLSFRSPELCDTGLRKIIIDLLSLRVFKYFKDGFIIDDPNANTSHQCHSNIAWFCLIACYKLWTLELIFSAKDPIVEKSCRH